MSHYIVTLQLPVEAPSPMKAAKTFFDMTHDQGWIVRVDGNGISWLIETEDEGKVLSSKKIDRSVNT